MENLVQHCGGFWASPQLRQVVEDGTMLTIDTAFFINELSALLEPSAAPSRLANPDQGDDTCSPTESRERRREWGDAADHRGRGRSRGRSVGPRRRSRSRGSVSSDVRRSSSPQHEEMRARQESWRGEPPDKLGEPGTGWGRGDASRLRSALRAFINDAPWAMLCGRLLHSLPDEALLDFAADVLSDKAGSRSEAAGKLALGRVHWHTLDDMMLAAALACRSTQLWRLIVEDGDAMQVRIQLHNHNIFYIFIGLHFTVVLFVCWKILEFAHS